MSLDQYRLLDQLGAGPDGVSYRGEKRDDRLPVEVRILNGARAEPGRWLALRRRLRLAALLEHPTAVRILEVGAEYDPPFMVLERLEGKPLAEDLQGRL